MLRFSYPFLAQLIILLIKIFLQNLQFFHISTWVIQLIWQVCDSFCRDMEAAFLSDAHFTNLASTLLCNSPKIPRYVTFPHLFSACLEGECRQALTRKAKLCRHHFPGDFRFSSQFRQNTMRNTVFFSTNMPIHRHLDRFDSICSSLLLSWIYYFSSGEFTEAETPSAAIKITRPLLSLCSELVK